MTISNSLNPVAEKQYVFGLNNKSENGNNTMIVDSGTSFLMLPSPDVDLLFDYLNYE